MAEAEIAYVATAGAAGLALALSAWAARLRGRLAVRYREAEADLVRVRAELADCGGAFCRSSVTKQRPSGTAHRRPQFRQSCIHIASETGALWCGRDRKRG